MINFSVHMDGEELAHKIIREGHHEEFVDMLGTMAYEYPDHLRERLLKECADCYNGSHIHDQIADFLRELADAIEAGESK